MDTEIENGLGANTLGSFFMTKSSEWSVPSQRHVISYKDLVKNPSNDNLSGELRIYITSKTQNKAALLKINVIKTFLSYIIISVIHKTESSNISRLEVASVKNDIVVSTDPDCNISWVFWGAI